MILRVRLTNSKPKALADANRLYQQLSALPGIAVLTGPGAHTSAEGQLFFYVKFASGTAAQQEKKVRKATQLQLEIDALDAIPAVDECLNCGNVADKPVARCPNCGFCEIENCPRCANSVARVEYQKVSGDLFRCPRCDTPVRLRFVEPLWRDDGRYNEPVVVVSLAAGE